MTDRRPVLRQLNVVARDVPAMVEFYERLGLEVSPGPSGWERDHVSPTTTGAWDLDVDSRAFAAIWNAGWDASPITRIDARRRRTRHALDPASAAKR